MKKIISFMFLCCLMLTAQSNFYQYRILNPVGGAKLTGHTAFARTIGLTASYSSITWAVSGTLAACTVQVDYSNDGTTVAGQLIAAQTCTSNGTFTAGSTSTPSYVRVSYVIGSGGGTLTFTAYGCNNSTCQGSGGGSLSSITAGTGITLTPNPITTTGTVALTIPVAKTSGGTGTTTPALVAGTNISITGTWPNNTINATGSGTVTSFSAGTLSPLFTTSVATATTTPALTFSLTNAAANTVFGNFTGSSGAPSYNAVSACGDGTHALKWTAGTGFACQAISVGTGTVTSIDLLGTTNQITVTGTSPITSSGTWILSLPSTLVLPSGTTATTQSVGDNTTKVSTTAFVTNAIAQGNPAIAVLAASTTTNTAGIYTAVGAGIGDTFTVTATGAFTLDGVAINTIGQRVLFKSQTDATQNGVYTATVVGALGISPIFTRALDYDQPGDINYTAAIQVQSGTVNALTSWLLTNQVSSIGPAGSNLNYSQFSTAPVSNGTLTIASGTSAMGTSAISSGTCATVVTTSATGTATTDVIIATPNTDPTGVTGYAVASGGSLYIQGYPTSNNVNFKVCNPTSGPLTPLLLILNWKVVR